MKLTKLLPFSLTGLCLVALNLPAAGQPGAAVGGASAGLLAQPAPPQSTAGLARQINDLLQITKAKSAAGHTSEGDLATEMKQIESLLQAHAGEKSEDLAHLAYLQAEIYANFFGQREKATILLNQVIATYPNTVAARNAATYLPQVGKIATDALTRLTDALIHDMATKGYNGHESEQDMAPELKQLANLLAEHKGDRSDEVARVALVQAQTYAKYLGQRDKALSLLDQMMASYPGTSAAQRARDYLPKAAGEAADAATRNSLIPGKSFPDFATADISGLALSVAKFKGKVVLLDFWATWCEPCLAELPTTQKLYAQFHKDGFEIIGISLDTAEGKPSLPAFLAARNMTWPEFCDGREWQNQLARKYGVWEIPSTILIDQNGKIIGRQFHGEALTQAVSQAMAALARKPRGG